MQPPNAGLTSVSIEGAKSGFTPANREGPADESVALVETAIGICGTAFVPRIDEERF